MIIEKKNLSLAFISIILYAKTFWIIEYQIQSKRKVSK